MYQLTIFNRAGNVISMTLHDEYPTNISLRSGQWIDICRMRISDALFLEHLLEEHSFV